MSLRRPKPLARRAAAAVVCLALAAGLALWRAAPALAAEGDETLGFSPEELGLAEEDLPAIDASCAAVVDDEGRVLFGRAAREPAQIASLTKIMTAAVAAEHLAADDAVTVTPTAASVGESSAGLLAGDVLSFDDALKALLTASGNDAAIAIAEAAGGLILADAGQPGAGPEEAQATFVDAMNAKAAEWGLEATVFANPHGLDFDQWAQGQASCARDVAETLRRAMESDLVRASIGFSQTDIRVMRGGAEATVSLANTDELLKSYEGACAAKTGYTLAAGPCAAGAAVRDGREYYVAVLGSSSKAQRFADEAALLDWAIGRGGEAAAAARELEESREREREEAAEAERRARTARFQLVATARTVEAEIGGERGAYPLVALVAHADWPRRTVPATVAEPGKIVELPSEGPRIEQEATFFEVSGDVRAGDVVGRLAFRRGGEAVWETDLVAAEDVAAPAWWEAVGIALERFVGGLTGAPAAAESELLTLGTVRLP
ncbi:D-alanyl-D-alanine carboxypeptidase family protein [Arabiibacter massiliensis]|uniref:D-alanyl-D-alanine carboxypeptidase n=1 Tax=Arabiibacter massiliensis TaxID=1870985 RepID=UPI0009BBCF2D|nr:D-alanyl-D-alanine carboxypeptidase [Arabiibacter massiliensis]